MSLYFNFWAPTSSWGDAYDAGLQPVSTPEQDQVCGYQIDYVEVCVPEPGMIGLLATAGLAAALIAMRRRKAS
jgi:hypothetical protein